MKTLIVCSGGLDSVTLAHLVHHDSTVAALLSFNYGQRHTTELDYARRCAQALAVRHDVVDISQFGRMLSGSALTDDIAVPEGHYAEGSMRVTIVPNRNAIMLAMAFGVAASNECDAVAVAVHGGDHFIYPDCRPDFINSFAAMQAHALEGARDVQLLAPFLNVDKAEIVRRGAAINVPFVDTWSCYQGGKEHCGRCGTCVERREAFALADVTDPTLYADADFWREAVQAHQAKGTD